MLNFVCELLDERDVGLLRGMPALERLKLYWQTKAGVLRQLERPGLTIDARSPYG